MYNCVVQGHGTFNSMEEIPKRVITQWIPKEECFPVKLLFMMNKMVQSFESSEDTLIDHLIVSDS